MPKPTTKEILEDPKYEAERLQFGELFNVFLDKRAEAEKKKREANPETENVFDVIFGGK